MPSHSFECRGVLPVALLDVPRFAAGGSMNATLVAKQAINKVFCGLSLLKAGNRLRDCVRIIKAINQPFSGDDLCDQEFLIGSSDCSTLYCCTIGSG
jgi:hypothetical protein